MSLNTEKYFKRDLSWLRFNDRVLQEAADSRNPLMERLKFLAIFSSNLDEFFKVRVSDIRKIKKIEKPLRKKLITKPNKLLKKIFKEVNKQQDKFGNIYRQELVPLLRKNNIFIKRAEELDEIQLAFIKDFYQQNKSSFEVSKDYKDIFLENEALYLVGYDLQKGIVWAKISDEIDRFVAIPGADGSYNYIFTDDILRDALSREHNHNFFSVKISRDAELYVENEYSGDLLEKIEAALPNRKTGQVTRALIDRAMPEDLMETITGKLDINETDVILGGKYHNFKDFLGFPEIPIPELYYQPLPPLENKSLQCTPDIFDCIDAKDQLLHFPYESFQDIVRLVNTAASNKEVTTIKMTLYRVSKNSAIAKALLKAVKNGKKVWVFIETKARFDEENNIKWGKVLAENGAEVLFSYPGIKVHSKILYIEKQINQKKKAYCYIGTGNFNEKTSKVYTDYALLTANPKITSELAQVFKVLEGKLIITNTKNLLVSPFSARKQFTTMVESEIKNAKSGKEAYIILKLNSLQDSKLIKLLYSASNAGVSIRLLVRGICCLIPGVPDQSENITVTSIVDRFLEHGRVYIFANGGAEKLYIGSADWMTRNLDHRIEVITPILDQDIAAKVRKLLMLQLEDNVKARIIDEAQNNYYVDKNSGIEASSQHLIYNYLS